MPTIPDDLRQRLQRHGQEHVLAAWDRLSEDERRDLLTQLSSLDLEGLTALYTGRDRPAPVPRMEQIKPVAVVPANSPDNPEARAAGEQALRQGEVAVLLVAGGQGSRLGFEHPKGMYPVGPVSRKSLFQIHAEKILALRRRFGAPIPFLMMTSHATQAETETYFRERHFFGLPPDEVFFFLQGTMPALDLATGKLLLEKPGRLFLSPDGHGGSLTALANSGLLDRLRQRGVKHLFYFQVDNPLVKIADPTFLGQHLRHRAEASSKVIAKTGPDERMGVFAQVDRRCLILEYSDLPKNLTEEIDETGRLRLWAGSPAIHLFDIAFLERVTRGPSQLPFHLAHKRVPYVDEAGKQVEPDQPNALKFERFVFDVLPLAERWLVVEGLRAEEFAPLKNATGTGTDSPETVEKALTELTAMWLKAAGVTVPSWPDGSTAVPLEVSPLFALDVEEFVRRVDRSTKIDGPKYFEEKS